LPRKFGQHFLVDQSVLQRIAEAACGSSAERVIEIGSGRGALTRLLLRRTAELHCVEIDEKLVEYLAREFSGASNLHLHLGDVLATDLSQWGAGVIAGNLPYYIASPILERFLALDERFPSAVFLLQLEVAERLLAVPGTREYGYLTVATRLVCDVDLICKIPPGAFRPPPKVQSAAVRLLRRPNAIADRKTVLELAARAFAHKRKTLRNNLRPFYGPAIDGIPEAGMRAEQLSVDRFVELSKHLQQLG
jgi:16S rRNA (adenine1518-N6/adenine1519-N6)-dimethyltransferase